MLLLGSKTTLTIEGVTIFPDHADSQQFWYLPAPVELARRGADNRASFTFIKFKPAAVAAGVKGGGFLTFEVSLRLSEELERKILAKLSSVAKGQPKLAAVPFDEGTVQCIALNVQGGGGTSAEPAQAGSFNAVEKILGATTPALYGDNSAAFSLTLDQEGAIILEKAFKDGTTPVGVIYNLKFTGIRPALEVKITADYKRIYDHFSAGLSAQYYFLQAGIEAGFEKLRQSGAIKIEVINFTTGVDRSEKENWALNFFKDNLLSKWFEPSLTPGQLAGGMAQPTALPNPSINLSGSTTTTTPTQPSTTSSQPSTTPPTSSSSSVRTNPSQGTIITPPVGSGSTSVEGGGGAPAPPTHDVPPPSGGAPTPPGVPTGSGATSTTTAPTSGSSTAPSVPSTEPTSPSVPTTPTSPEGATPTAPGSSGASPIGTTTTSPTSPTTPSGTTSTSSGAATSPATTTTPTTPTTPATPTTPQTTTSSGNVSVPLGGMGAMAAGMSGAPAISLKLKFIKQEELKTMTLQYNSSEAAQRTYAPQGFFGLLVADLDKAKHFVEVDLDDPFFRVFTATIDAPIDFAPIGLTSAHVALDYGTPADAGNHRHQEFIFDAQNHDSKKWEVFMNQTRDTTYTYNLQYHFNPSSGWEGEKFSYELPPRNTEDRTLLLNPSNDLGFLEIQVVPNRIDWGVIESTEVHLQYQDSKGWSRKKSFAFTAESPTQTWKLRSSDSNARSYSYRVLHHLKDGTTRETAPVTTEASAVSIDDPFEGALEISFFPAFDTTRTRLVMIDVEYRDPVNKYNRDERLRVAGDAPPDEVKMRISLMNPKQQSFRYKYTFIGTDGRIKRLPFSAETTDREFTIMEEPIS